MMNKSYTTKVLHEVRYESGPGCFSRQVGHKKRLLDLPKADRIVKRLQNRGWYAFTAPVRVKVPVQHRKSTQLV